MNLEKKVALVTGSTDGLNETRANAQAHDAGARRKFRELNLDLIGLSQHDA